MSNPVSPSTKGGGLMSWKFIAVALFGVLIGGTPSHVSMLFWGTKDHEKVIKHDQDIQDLKDSVKEMADTVGEGFRRQAEFAANLDKNIGILTQQVTDHLRIEHDR